jgi:hypothetical protein
MQEVLSAALAYYVNNGAWPTAGTPAVPATLASSSLIPTYLPSISGDMYPFATVNKAGNNKFLVWVTAQNSFLIAAPMPSLIEATIVAGLLPGSATMNDGTAPPGGYYATAQVNIPGQNLNNARSINFGSVYHTGACVPVPTCPTGMTAQIFAVPMSVRGVNDQPTKSDRTPCTTSTVYGATGAPVNSGDCAGITTYPISSFSTYVTGPAAANGAAGPSGCNGGGASSCYTDAGTGNWATVNTGANFWRVCLSVYTEKGAVVITPATPSSGMNGNSYNMYWAESLGDIFVTTRCTPNGGEPSGSSLNVWSNN